MLCPSGQATGSRRYVGRGHALLGQIALAEGAPARAVTELGEAIRIARDIEHPTLTWQAAHQLARAEAAVRHVDEASAAARLCRETSRPLPPALRRPTFVRAFWLGLASPGRGRTPRGFCAHEAPGPSGRLPVPCRRRRLALR